MSGQLVRILNTIPLMTLKQGCSLRILGSKRINLNVRIEPEWRDDTLLQLHQRLPSLTEKEKTDDELGDPCYYSSPDLAKEALMDVKLHKNVETSMGRKALMANVRVGLKKHNIVVEKAGLSQQSQPPLSREPTSKENKEFLEESSSIQNDSHGHDKRIESPPLLVLTAKVPEKINISCELQGPGSIEIEKKVEGDVSLKTKAGDITVSKLRGHNIQLEAGAKGIIHVKQLLEAEKVDLVARPGGRIRAMMINGKTINLNVLRSEDDPLQEVSNSNRSFEKLDVDDACAIVDVGSLYTSKHGEGAQVNVAVSGGSTSNPRNVRIKSNHGHVGVNTFISNDATVVKDEYDQIAPVVELGGVNGSCDVAVEKLEEEVQENLSIQQMTSEDRCMATKVHFDSLSQESISAVTTELGNVGITLDRKLEADLRMVSSPDISIFDFNILAMGNEKGIEKEFATYDKALGNGEGGNDPDMNTSPFKQERHHGIKIETDAFSPDLTGMSFHNFSFASGRILNRSHEPDSRFDVKMGSASSAGGVGKIRIESAASQALAGFEREQPKSGSHDGDNEIVDGDKDDPSEKIFPLLAVAAGGGGNIAVESTNWFGAIARRYGMNVDSIVPNSRAYQRSQIKKPPQ